MWPIRFGAGVPRPSRPCSAQMWVGTPQDPRLRRTPRADRGPHPHGDPPPPVAQRPPPIPVPVLAPRCIPVPALACRLWQRFSPSALMASMSSTDDARRTLWQLSLERLRARLPSEKGAGRRRSARGEECVTGGSGGASPSSGSIRARWSSGRAQPRQPLSDEEPLGSAPRSETSTMTASGGSGGSDCLLPDSASRAGSFRRKERLRPAGGAGGGGHFAAGGGDPPVWQSNGERGAPPPPFLPSPKWHGTMGGSEP